MAWHFSIISLQYIIGGSLSFAVTGYVLYRNPRALETISFFLYGLFTGVWMLFIFLHRTAPTAELSRLFFKTGMFSLQLQIACLLVTILCIRSPKKIYLLCLCPAIIAGLVELMLPTEIFWGKWGWSYEFLSSLVYISYISRLGYSVAICLILLLFAMKYRSLTVRKKHKIMLYGFILYVVGMAVTNYMISANPNFPPFGGLLTTIFFLFVAYAVILPTERIISVPESRELLKNLANSFSQFLNTLQAKTPGKELGGSSLRFQEYLKAMGLRDVVISESGKLIFNPGNLTDESLREVPDSILSVLKEHIWATETMNDFTPILVEIYEILRSQSKERADEWFEQMLKRHGTFLAEQGAFAAMPEQVKIPEVLKKLQSGRICLFQEEKPAEAYQLVKEALRYGFTSLCISKLHPGKVKERYDVGEDSILWLAFEKGERTISPKDTDKLNKTVSEFVDGTQPGIVLLDCLDQIKFAKGFQKSLDILKDLRNLCSKNDSILLISVNPEMFEKQELQAIEKGLKGVKTE